MRTRLLKTIILGLTLSFLFPVSNVKAAPIAVEQVRNGINLADYAFFMVDQASFIGIEQAGSLPQQRKYIKLSEGIPLFSTGALWMRFSLVHNRQIAADAKTNSDIILHLQKGTPPASMFVAQEISKNGDVFRWLEILPDTEGNFILPDPHNLPITIYTKFSGIPGLWFNPELLDRNVQEPAGWRHLPLAVQMLLALSLFICLARGIKGREEWRIWGAVIIGCVIIQAVFCRQSPVPGNIAFTDLPQLLAPGLTIILMPHLARHLLHSRKNKIFDFFLIIFSIPGVIAALLPILPGFAWSAKLMPLYPLLFLPLIIPASSMFSNKRPGGLTFLLLCILPLTGALLALIGFALSITYGSADSTLFQFGSNLPLLGYTAGALVLALSSPDLSCYQTDFFPVIKEDSAINLELKYNDLSLPDQNDLPQEPYTPETNSQNTISTEDSFDPTSMSVTDNDLQPLAEKDPLPLPLHNPENEATSPKDIRIIKITDDDEDWADMPQISENTDLPFEPDLQNSLTDSKTSDEDLYMPSQEEAGLTIIKSDEADDLTNQVEYFSQEVNPGTAQPDYQQNAGLPAEKSGRGIHPGMGLKTPYGNILEGLENLKRQQNDAEQITDNLESILHGLGLALNNLDNTTRGKVPGQPHMQSIFNLSNLVRSAHAETLDLAEAKGIALSWFVSPNLPLLYKGNEDALKNALSYMLKGAVEYAESGVIQLTVRQAPEHEEGVVQFSLTDNSINPHSARRPAKILSRAWELARASQGSFSINFMPDRGTSINFALKLQPLQGEDNAWASEKKAVGQVPAQQGSEDYFPDLSDIDISRTETPVTAKSITDTLPDAGLNISPDIGPKILPETLPDTLPETLPEILPDTEPNTLPDILPDAGPKTEVVAESLELVIPASITDASDFDELDLALQEKIPENITEPDEAAVPVRDTIVVADLTDSGRRLIARRLGDLPHFRLEARNAEEIVQGCSWGNVCLIIFDSYMPEHDIKKALQEVNRNEARAGRPPVPSLALLSHVSQGARMHKTGCTEYQVKTASREAFQELILKLAPMPLRKEQAYPETDEEPSPDIAPEAHTAPLEQLSDQPENVNLETVNMAKPDRSVPLMDLIVSSLDDEKEESEEDKNNEKERQQDEQREHQQTSEPDIDPLEQATKLAAERTAARAAENK